MWDCRGKYAVLRKVGEKYRLIVFAQPAEYLFLADENRRNRKVFDEVDRAEGIVKPEEKLSQSISRSRRMIFEYASCNPWEYFITLTLDPKKYDRYDLGKYKKELTQWIRDYSKRKNGGKIAYLLIPEQHEDGAWHIHGLLHGLKREALAEFVPGLHPQYLIDNGYLNWPDYASKFGFCSLSPVKNPEAVSKYITKYITKDMARLNQEYHAHLYYASLGLKKAEVVAQDILMVDMVLFDYSNEYCGIRTFDTYQEAWNAMYTEPEEGPGTMEWEKLPTLSEWLNTHPNGMEGDTWRR